MYIYIYIYIYFALRYIPAGTSVLDNSYVLLLLFVFACFTIACRSYRYFQPSTVIGNLAFIKHFNNNSNYYYYYYYYYYYNYYSLLIEDLNNQDLNQILLTSRE